MMHEDIDVISKEATVAAMRNILELDGDKLMPSDEVYSLYIDICDLDSQGIDPFIDKGIRVWDTVFQKATYQSSHDVIVEIYAQSDVIERAMRDLLKTTHEGLIEMAVNDQLGSDVNTWDLAHAASIGAALANKSDALAPSDSVN